MNLKALGEAAERHLTRLDEAVPVASEIDNTVLPDPSRLTRLAGPALLVLSVGLVPWTAYLAYTLPDQSQASHYNASWVGFDVMLIAALLATAWCALRRSRRLTMVASVTGTLLVVDAWFDVMMASGRAELWIALGMAVAAELPLAVLCFWLSHHTHQLTAFRIRLALRSRPGRRPI